jgi:hypothetical protein
MSLAHPPKNQLIAFGQGKLAQDESLSIETHLESCSVCCETLLDLKDDTFTGLLRQAQQINVAAKKSLSQSANEQTLDRQPADASRQPARVTESKESDSHGALARQVEGSCRTCSIALRPWRNCPVHSADLPRVRRPRPRALGQTSLHSRASRSSAL